MPSAMNMVVTPAVLSPLSTVHWMGAAPRYLGSKEPWTLTQPSLGASSTALGSSLPYATTTMTSAPQAWISRWVSSPRRFTGWNTGMLCRRASSLTGGGCSLWPRPLGLSGWVYTAQTS